MISILSQANLKSMIKKKRKNNKDNFKNSLYLLIDKLINLIQYLYFYRVAKIEMIIIIIIKMDSSKDCIKIVKILNKIISNKIYFKIMIKKVFY